MNKIENCKGCIHSKKFDCKNVYCQECKEIDDTYDNPVKQQKQWRNAKAY